MYEVFVGREDMLATLHQSLQPILVPQPSQSIVLIQGDYGTGKSALLQQFLREIRIQHSNLVIGQGSCSLEKESVGLTPFIELLRDLDQSVGASTISDRLRALAGKVAPAWLDFLTGGVYSVVTKTSEGIRDFIGKREQVQFTQENVFIQYSNMIRQIVDKRAGVLVIEDLHWADETSLRLLFYLARTLKDLPIMFIASYRPVEALETGPNREVFGEIRANLKAGHPTHELTLSAGIDVNTYLGKRYLGHEIPLAFIHRIQEATEGHPLFVAQLLKLWEENGVLVEKTSGDRTCWSLAKPDAEITIPDSLSAVLEERLRRMGQHLQEVLSGASVEGDQFSLQVLGGLLSLDSRQLATDVKALTNNYHLLSGKSGEARLGRLILDFYQFAHRFFREYVYGTLEDVEKRLLHAKAAECLEALCSDNLAAVATSLARHYGLACDYPKGTRYALLAAQVEASYFHWLEARQWCNYGLDMLKFLPEDTESRQLLFQLLSQLAEIIYDSGDFEHSVPYLKQAIDLGQTIKIDPLHLARLFHKAADAYDEVEQLSYEDGVVLARRGLQMLKDAGHGYSEQAIEMEGILGLLLSRLDRFDEAAEIFPRLIALTETLPMTPSLQAIMVGVHNDYGVYFDLVDDYSPSMQQFRKAIAYGESLKQVPVFLYYVYINLAETLMYFGEFDEADELVWRGIEGMRAIGHIDEAYALGIAGEIALERNDGLRALELLEYAVQLVERYEVSGSYSMVYSDFAMAHLMAGHRHIAQRKAKQALELVNPDDHPGYSLQNLARAEAALGNYAEADRIFNDSIVCSENKGWGSMAGETRHHYAQALEVQGRVNEAITQLEKAIEELDEVNWTYRADLARQALEALRSTLPPS